jgi:hypothetical protein
MNFLKKLFGGGAGSHGGFYVYVRPKACDEILKIRLDTKNSLSRRDDGSGYFMRKMATGARCPFQAEMYFYFDDRKNLVDKQVENGEFVTEEAYLAKYGTDDDT